MNIHKIWIGVNSDQHRDAKYNSASVPTRIDKYYSKICIYEYDVKHLLSFIVESNTGLCRFGLIQSHCKSRLQGFKIMLNMFELNLELLNLGDIKNWM